MDYQQGVPIRINDTFRVNGTATDPTQIVYSILGPDGTLTAYTWPGAPEVSHVGTGVFQLNLSPPALPGPYQYDVDATGAVFASRAGAFTVLPNVTSDDVPWAVVGPCQPWVSSQDVWNCCGQPTTVVDGIECNVDFTAEAMAASQILFELSGRLYTGACEKTARPCRSDCMCGIQMLSRGHIVGPWDWGVGVGWSGSGWSCGSSDDACGCNPLSRVLLSGYPVREILEVKIDGDVVDPDTYRLDGWRWLTRVRDPADPETPLMWPSCQITDLPDTEDGTFSVAYRYGQDPPLIGQQAAASLACQLYKACSGSGDGDCEIPANAIRVTRQGVTIDKAATISWFFGRRGDGDGGGWGTGIVQVDTFLNSFNRSGMQQRPKTWSPDGQRYAKVYGNGA